MPGTIRVERDGAVGWLVFDHAERRNAITADMWRDIPRAAEELDRDDAVRVIVLRGAGDEAFVAGADISEFDSVRTGEVAEAYEARNRAAFAALADLAKPCLAMIHGFCFGGGVGLAITADVRIAAEDAVFAVPAARLGLGYPAEGLDTLLRLVGPSVTKEIFFTARRLTAGEALAKGLVNEVVAKRSLEGHVRARAEEIAANAPLTLRSVKLLVRELAKPPSTRDAEAMAGSIRACFTSEDYREGVRAFLDKRRPVFRGC